MTPLQQARARYWLAHRAYMVEIRRAERELAKLEYSRLKADIVPGMPALLRRQAE